MAEHDRSHSSTSLSSSDGANRKVVTKTTTTVMPYDIKSGVIPPPGTQEEWTTTKRRINHKTKQVETRVQRQIIMEDGKVIADSGPQVTTKTTEDQKSDETEDTKHRLLADSEVPEKYRKDIGNQVVAEKTVTHNVTKEAKEENFQYHDESLRELEGSEIHRKAVKAPHELIRIQNEIPAIPKGKLVHFSAKGRKTNDRDEILEVSRLGKDGLLSTETTQTQYHEDFEDDEVPEDDHNQALTMDNSSQRYLEYNQPVPDYDVDHRTSSRTNSSLSMSRNEKNSTKTNRNVKKLNTNKRDLTKNDSGSESDIIETSEVYRLSDKIRSLKTKNKNVQNYAKMGRTKKDDASTQASLSDSDEDRKKYGKFKTSDHNRKQEVHERIEAKKSTFNVCDPNDKHKKHYYFGTDPMSTAAKLENGNKEKGYISSQVKTSKFAMENDRVLEDKTFEEDFERSFKDKHEQNDVKREYDRFVERTKEHTKDVRDRITSSTLSLPKPSFEYVHRPLMIDSAEPSSDYRTQSFYDHQIRDYENKSKVYKHNYEPKNYSTMPPRVSDNSSPTSDYIIRSSSPARTSTWTKKSNHYNNYNHRSHDYNGSTSNLSYNRPPSSSYRSTSRTDFPDFEPLTSPLEIKSLTENAMKSRHITTYN